MNSDRLLAIISARGGSKGLPGKNIRSFAGLPLIAHSILLAKSCPQITRTVISTDSDQIADVAKQFGADVPFLRPAELAQDDTPLWPVLRHALQYVEKQEERQYDYVLLLDPTTPCRLKSYISESFSVLRKNSEADGIVGVSRPDFNPIWNCVVSKKGWMASMFPEGDTVHRRQDAPDVYRINGSIYIWKAGFMRKQEKSWRDIGKFLMYEIPDFAAISIDTDDEFRRAELYVTSGMVYFPWLENKESTCKP